MTPADAPEISFDLAMEYLLHYLRSEPPDVGGYLRYGYDLFLPTVIRTYLFERENHISDTGTTRLRMREVSPPFYDAAWDLARRGIVRAGVSILDVSGSGGPGEGFSLTQAGRRWLEELPEDSILIAPSRIGDALADMRLAFGDGYHERAQEAVRCYNASAFYGCCAMSGAAAESILLRVAIIAIGDEESVLREYRRASGRRLLESRILAGKSGYLQREFRSFTDLLNYWRDEAAHGYATSLRENDAYMALGRLLRFGHFVRQNWMELTGPSP